MNTVEWFNSPMRWAQLTFTDTDPGNMDPDVWLEYFREIKANGAVIGTGGYMAFHPTEIPLHYQAATLGDSDLFGYLVEGCRKIDMSVICRTDAHAVHADARHAHPEWIAVNKNGDYIPHWSMPDVWVTCALGPYNFDFMNLVNREIMRNYSVDAIFCNRWSGSGMCYCDSCRTQFREYAGIEIPLEPDRESDEMIQYLQWREKRLFELCEHWDSELRQINPKSRFIPNSGGGASSDLDMIRLGDYSSVLFIDRQSRHGIMPPWGNGRNGKELRSVMGKKPIGGIFSTGVEQQYRWKDSVQREPELRVWVAEAVANGMSPWFTKFCGRVYDDRWMPVVKDLYRTYADWEPYLRYDDPVADAAILFSQDNARYYARSKTKELVDSPISGFYQALLEDRTLFEMVHANAMDLESLKKFRTIILPNVAALSDTQCDIIREYVRQGGGLVATFETSLLDEKGNRRSDFALADLFGVHAGDGPVEGPMKNSYIQVNHEINTDTVLIHRGLENAGRIINTVYRVPIGYDRISSGSSPFTLVPTYPDLPMEEVYPREPDMECPEIFFSRYGEGRVVYFAGDMDRWYWEFLTPDHGQVLANSVLWAMQGRRTVDVAGKGFLDVTCWRDGPKVSIHIVNMTNPFALRGAMRETFPVTGLEVKIRIDGEVSGDIRALTAGCPLEHSRKDEWLRIQIPAVDIHEVIVFELEEHGRVLTRA